MFLLFYLGILSCSRKQASDLIQRSRTWVARKLERRVAVWSRGNESPIDDICEGLRWSLQGNICRRRCTQCFRALAALLILFGFALARRNGVPRWFRCVPFQNIYFCSPFCVWISFFVFSSLKIIIILRWFVLPIQGSLLHIVWKVYKFLFLFSICY